MTRYRDSGVPAHERVADLLSRMTVDEKAAQMMCVWQKKAETLVDEHGAFSADKARAAFADGNGIGQVGRPSDAGGSGHEPEKGRGPRQMAELTNAIQKFFIEESRLGIPVIFHEECLHGLAAVGSTSFPQPIALASTWNPELVESLYAMTAHEARVRGTHQALTPVVDVARDARWGRVEETFGEDPHLVSRMGVAAVRGFQGDASFQDGTRVLATMKHFVAHGQPEAGMNCAPVNVSMRELREVFLPPFEAAIREGGAASVMASYNEVDGVPSHASEWLLRDVLRQEWGFEGFVVSDYYAIWELNDRPDTHGHWVAADKREACALAVRAGVNIEFPEPDCYLHLAELVADGTLSEAQLDDMVAPMLLWKFRMGLFDDPYVDPAEAERVVGSEENRKLAHQAACESITLLKNDGVLPLDAAKLSTIAVVGPNAGRALLGGYSGVPPRTVSVLDGIRARAGESVEVLYAEGCKITVGGSWNEDAVVASDPKQDRKQIAEAVEIAALADVIIVAVGENEQTSREAWSRAHMGDRTSLDLVGRQQELVDAMIATGKPVIVLLFNGRPLALPAIKEHAPAILECWYLGQETGHAVAEILFGDADPSGRLPISFPRSVGHLPVFYNHKPSARRGYLWDDASPLWAFGEGIGYTTFSIDNVRLDDAEIGIDGTTRVLADVTNTGDRAGTQTVQMYVRDRVSSVTRPVKELKGFRRVTLQPGQTETVQIPIGPEQLAFWDVRMNRVVEPGEFEIRVGASSRDADLQTVVLRVTG
ncbi:glycoside hydrolase family 3 N-terminal domain-containing protein [Longimicrobium terrae]|uniref:Beta-glucosidase n=1 Tax=Longimicrobium terrae TaxID=1639882 RepID=A0A841H3Z6_9BACT|nr:glycoside hydrolase family 3 N-terminal domain-containing protein [Longimicrobium terrae]MBB4638485.1 beta-glucosidase [Longimicrobium terrae]MBB6072672.1 beta-glucosidase [Longimicrobium terrae]NNC32452.1 beta-glucosidase [Longimicrobium terrae]